MNNDRLRLSAKSQWDDLLNAAHVWQFCPDVEQVDALERQCLAWLSPAERARRERFSNDALRHTYLATRVLCRTTLSHYAGVDPPAWTFAENAHGKPHIESPAEFRSLRFNLTHTDGLISCIVTRIGEVGIDAEEISRAVDVEAVTRHFFSRAENALLAKLPATQRAERFFEMWVGKEAYLKGLGTGLSQPPEALTIEWDGDGKARTQDGWHLQLHRPTPRHVAATAVRCPPGFGTAPVEWRIAEGLTAS